MLSRSLLLISALTALALVGCGPAKSNSGDLVAPVCGFPHDPRCPDAGVDAGATDAGDQDAGPTDAGDLDAGDVDAS